jgi:hypothetical protein
MMPLESISSKKDGFYWQQITNPIPRRPPQIKQDEQKKLSCRAERHHDCRWQAT